MSTCATCGAPEVPDGPAQRVLVSVVDETGATTICALCVVAVLEQARTSTDITVFVNHTVVPR